MGNLIDTQSYLGLVSEAIAVHLEIFEFWKIQEISSLMSRGARLTSVTLRTEQFSAILIGILLRFGWSGVNLTSWITTFDGLNILEVLGKFYQK